MAAQTVYSNPSPSQWASAAAHLDRQSEWRAIRIDGTRYIVVPSANSDRTYWVRADAAGCSCPFYTRTWNQCAHQLAVYLAATEEELEEEYVVGSATLKAMRDLYPGCAGGCGAITEGSHFCDDCSAVRARAETLAAARRRVLQEVMG